MIPMSKIAAVGSVVLCGALATSVPVQEPAEATPGPSPATQQPEQPAPLAPRPPSSDEGDDRTIPPPPPRPDSPDQPQVRFIGPPGLSEAAKRSFTEIPPGTTMGEEEAVAPEEAPAPRAPAPPPSPRSGPAQAPRRPEYVVEPPDVLIVEVLEALPGRPISGERLVRPDGRIGLGFYGDIPVASLTLPQIKEKVVLHLRKFLDDETLGLIAVDENGECKRDAYGRPVLKDPKETDRVFVDVTLYNSQRNYVLGEVASPGHICYTGGDTVLDLIQYAGGLLPTADKARVRLIRSFPKGSPAKVLPVNYEEIAMGTDSSTNYAILPNDRLVVPRIAATRPGGDPGVGASDGEVPRQDVRAARASAPRSAPSVYFDRGAYDVARKPTADLEKRIEELEKKLDRLIQMVQRSRPRPGESPAAKNGEHPTIAGAPGQAGAVEPQPRRGMTAPDRRPGPRRPGPRRVGPMEPRPAPQPPYQDDPDQSPPQSRAVGPGLPDLPPSRPDVLPPSESPPDQ